MKKFNFSHVTPDMMIKKLESGSGIKMYTNIKLF